MTLRWTPLSENVVRQWSELTTLLAEVDRTEEVYAPEDLAEELGESGVDAERDTWGVWDGDLLVAYGQLHASDGLSDGRAPVRLAGGVHPDFRGRGIGTALMDRMEHRAHELAAARHPGVPVTLRAPGGLPGDPVRPLLEHRGYRVVRYFTQMKRSLPGAPIPLPQKPVQPFMVEQSEAVRQAHNDAFATHWGSAPRSEESWADLLGSRTFRPGPSFVEVAPDGEVRAYVLCYQWVDQELYVGQVGTRQAHRGQGLARACLVAALRAAVQQGYTSVDLGVDSQNPSGAGALYESVGFSATRTFAAYAREEPSPTSG